MIALGEKMDVDMPTYRKVAQNSRYEYTVSHSLESRYRNLFHFGISIRYYSVLFVTGLSLAYWVIYKLYQDQKFLTKNLIPCSFTACWVLLSVLAWDIVCSMNQAIGSLTL